MDNEKMQDLTAIEKAYLDASIAIEDTSALLVEHLNQNEDLKQSIAELIQYLGARFISCYREEKKRLEATELIPDVIYAQVLHGFYIMLNEISADKVDDGTKKNFDDEFWQKSSTEIRGMLPPLLRQMGGEHWYFNDNVQNVSSRVLHLLNEGYDTYELILENAAVYGAYLAMLMNPNIDKNVVKNPVLQELDDTLSELLLGKPSEAIYLTSDTFLMFDTYVPSYENWALYRHIKGENKWIGTVSLIDIISIDYSNFEYILQLAVENIVPDYEVTTISKELLKLIPEDILDKVEVRILYLAESPIITTAANINGVPTE